MKISSEFETLINKQIHLQWSAFYEFLAMAAWLETTPFKGFAKWMLLRSEREQEHAIKLFEYLRNRAGTLYLAAIKEPVKVYESPLDAFQKALEKKRMVTTATNNLYSRAISEKDLETHHFLNSILKEQVMEEKHMQDIVDKIVLAGRDADALIHLDYKEEVSYSKANS